MMKFRYVTLGLLFSSCLPLLAEAKPAANWIGTWAASPMACAVESSEPSAADSTYRNVVRISLGAAIVQAAYGLASRAATELFTAGTYDLCAGGVDYGSFNASLTRT